MGKVLVGIVILLLVIAMIPVAVIAFKRTVITAADGVHGGTT